MSANDTKHAGLRWAISVKLNDFLACTMSAPESANEFAPLSSEGDPVLARNMEIAKAGARRAELYFADEPELYEQYRNIRTQLLGMLRDLTKQTQEKAPALHRYAQHFEANMRIRVNDFLLGLYSLLGLKENLQIRRAFLEERPVYAQVRPQKEFNQMVRQSKKGKAPFGQTIFSGSGISVEIFDSPHARQSYAFFEMIVAHELVHAFSCQMSYHESVGMEEGVTQLVTQKLLQREGAYYEKLTEVAEALFELDSQGLLVWYATGDTFTYLTSLEHVLRQYHSPRKAEWLALMVTKFFDYYLSLLYKRAQEEIDLEEDDPLYREKVDELMKNWLREELISELKKR